MIEVSEIADRLNRNAAHYAAELLPNGHRSGNYWMASGIDDTGKSGSLAVTLAGAEIGRWTDYGNARSGEERGDILDLARHKLFGGDMRAAVDWAKKQLGIEDRFVPGATMSQAERAKRAAEAQARAERREADLAVEREAKARGARSLFLQGVPIAGTPAESYLRGRGLGPGAADSPTGGQWPGSLRFHDEVWCKAERVKVPALLCGIFNPQGRQIGTHRIYLQKDEGRWRKLATAQPKMVLGNMGGGFIPINKGQSRKSMAAMPEGEPVYVTEGPEDAVCVRMMKPDARILCAISLGNMGAIVLPPRAGPMVIVADRDSGEQAQATLERAIAKQQARGRQVQLVLPPEKVAGLPVKDINEWLQALAISERAAEKRRRA